MLFWHVPAPNEALLISGSKRRKDATQFRIVTGHGSFVMPVKQQATAAVAGPARGGDHRGVHHQPGHPAERPRGRRVQGRRRPGVDRQRGPPLPVRAGPDGDPGRPGLRRAPAVDHRRADRRADHQGAGPGRPGGQGRQPRRDGEARHRRRRAGDPGDRGRLRLHQQPRRPARRRRRPARPGSPRRRPTWRRPSASWRPAR